MGAQPHVNGRTHRLQDMLFWPGITCAFHLPASVAPIGLSDAGLPIGVQIVGPLYGDRTTIAVAELLEQSWRAFTPPPGLGLSPLCASLCSARVGSAVISADGWPRQARM